MMAGAFVAQRAIDQHKIGRRPLGRDLSGGGDADEKPTAGDKKLFGDQHGKWCAYSTCRRCRWKARHAPSHTYPCDSRPSRALCGRGRRRADGAQCRRRDRGRRLPARSRPAGRVAAGPLSANLLARILRAHRAALLRELLAPVVCPSCRLRSLTLEIEHPLLMMRCLQLASLS